jgi:hypothetical protein
MREKPTIQMKIILTWYVTSCMKCFCTQERFNPLTLELNPSPRNAAWRDFYWDFASWTMHFINICLKTQQMQQLFIQFINYVW